MNSKFILGVDPSLNSTGWAILSVCNNSFSLVDYGIIKHESINISYLDKIFNIGSEIERIILKYKILDIGMEDTFCNMNPKSSLKLGMVRGAIVFCAKKHNAQVCEYETKVIKKAIVGSGGASKQQVSFMVSSILGGKNLGVTFTEKQYDITDAVGAAIAHYNISTSRLNI